MRAREWGRGESRRGAGVGETESEGKSETPCSAVAGDSVSLSLCVGPQTQLETGEEPLKTVRLRHRGPV